jgi:hypothetical protein
MSHVRILALIPMLLAVLMGCQDPYYDTMEAFGKHKRALLISRIESTKQELVAGRAAFDQAATGFRNLVNSAPGAYRDSFEDAEDDYEECEDRSRALRRRIQSVEGVAEALFKEWENELANYTSGSLRRTSRDQLRTAREKYDDMIAAMNRAADSTEPVLIFFKDQSLFLKHNLNGSSLASLKEETPRMEEEMKLLQERLEHAEALASEFITVLGSTE